jgi:hypothetical protein
MTLNPFIAKQLKSVGNKSRVTTHIFGLITEEQ